jgi:aminoglycoside phosphotransferase (APT) family kinase protein
LDRIKGFDYSKYPGGPDLTKRVLRFMYDYALGCEIDPYIIHGDPVFSNILYDTSLDIKFIDMRGKLSNTHTILGDPCYDLAKIYQSLMGYDFVLNDRRIVRNTELIDIFEQHVNNYGLSMKTIKQMTGCLYVSLVPLHDNDKCVKYLELGQKLLEE